MMGFSLELGDRRVDKIISKNGFKKSEIFYIPVSVWFIYWIMLSIVSVPMTLEVLFNYFSKFSFQRALLFALIYVFTCCLIVIFLNRSFAIADKEFLVINSHFPFGSLKRFKFEEISEIKISSDWKLKILIIFGLFYSNYVQVKIKNQKKKFYCLFLDVDCHDENWTEKTLDDLERSLKLKDVNVKMEI